MGEGLTVGTSSGLGRRALRAPGRLWSSRLWVGWQLLLGQLLLKEFLSRHPQLLTLPATKAPIDLPNQLRTLHSILPISP